MASREIPPQESSQTQREQRARQMLDRDIETVKEKAETGSVSVEIRGKEAQISYFIRRGNETNPDKQKSLVHVHGIGCSKFDFAGAIEQSKLDQYTLVSFDFPGCGESAPMADERLDMDDLAEITHQVLSQLNIGRHAVIGHSMGAAVAMEYITRHADSNDIEGFINVEGDLKPRDVKFSYSLATQERDKIIASDKEQLSKGLSDENDLGYNRYTALVQRFTDPGTYHDYARGIIKIFTLQNFVRTYQDIEENYGALYVLGQQSSELHTRTKYKRREIIADSGHFPFVNNPEEYYDQIASWLENNNRENRSMPTELNIDNLPHRYFTQQYFDRDGHIENANVDESYLQYLMGDRRPEAVNFWIIETLKRGEDFLPVLDQWLERNPKLLPLFATQFYKIIKSMYFVEYYSIHTGRRYEGNVDLRNCARVHPHNIDENDLIKFMESRLEKFANAREISNPEQIHALIDHALDYVIFTGRAGTPLREYAKIMQAAPEYAAKRLLFRLTEEVADTRDGLKSFQQRSILIELLNRLDLSETQVSDGTLMSWQRDVGYLDAQGDLTSIYRPPSVEAVVNDSPPFREPAREDFFARYNEHNIPASEQGAIFEIIRKEYPDLHNRPIFNDASVAPHCLSKRDLGLVLFLERNCSATDLEKVKQYSYHKPEVLSVFALGFAYSGSIEKIEKLYLASPHYSTLSLEDREAGILKKGGDSPFEALILQMNRLLVVAGRLAEAVTKRFPGKVLASDMIDEIHNALFEDLLETVDRREMPSISVIRTVELSRKIEQALGSFQEFTDLSFSREVSLGHELLHEQQALDRLIENPRLKGVLLSLAARAGNLRVNHEPFRRVDRDASRYSERLGVRQHWLENIPPSHVSLDLGPGAGVARKETGTNFGLAKDVEWEARTTIVRLIKFDKVEQRIGQKLTPAEKWQISDFLFKMMIIAPGQERQNQFAVNQANIDELNTNPRAIIEMLEAQFRRLPEVRKVPSELHAYPSAQGVVYPHKSKKFTFPKSMKAALQELSQHGKEKFLRRDIDPLTLLDVHPEGVIIGDFKRLKSFASNQVHRVTGVRSDVFVHGDDWIELGVQVARILKSNGGIYLSDSIRELYGRGYRTELFVQMLRAINNRRIHARIILGPGMPHEDIGSKVPLALILCKDLQPERVIGSNLNSGCRLVRPQYAARLFVA